MARVEFNPIIDRITGKCGDMVYKMRNGRQYAAKAPDCSGHVATQGELANRQKFKQATAYARAILADPEKRAPYDAAAAASGRIAFNLIVSEFYHTPAAAQAFALTENIVSSMEGDTQDIASDAPPVPATAASCDETANEQSEPAEVPAIILSSHEASHPFTPGREVAAEATTEPPGEPAQLIAAVLPDEPAARSRSRSRKRPRRTDRMSLSRRRKVFSKEDSGVPVSGAMTPQANRAGFPADGNDNGRSAGRRPSPMTAGMRIGTPWKLANSLVSSSVASGTVQVDGVTEQGEALLFVSGGLTG